MKLWKSDQSGTWHVRFKTRNDAGAIVDQEIDTHAETRSAAEELIEIIKLRELETAALASRLSAEAITRITAGRRISNREAFQEYQEWLKESKRQGPQSPAVIVVQAFLRDHDLLEETPAQIRPAVITKFVNRPHLKLSSRKMQRSAVAGFLNFCSTKGWVLGNAAVLATIDFGGMDHEQKEFRQKPIFTDMQIMVLMANVRDHEFWPYAIVLSRELGLRLSDVVRLEWSCFDLDGKVCTVHQSKTHERIQIAMSNQVVKLVKHVPKVHAKYLFPKERVAYQREPHPFRHEFRNLCRKIGFEGYSFHCLRKTYSTDMQARLAGLDGAALSTASAALGHKSPVTTLRHYSQPALVNPKSSL